jgi:hypothetical protein
LRLLVCFALICNNFINYKHKNEQTIRNEEEGGAKDSAASGGGEEDRLGGAGEEGTRN